MAIRPLKLCEDCSHGTPLQGPHGRFSCVALASPSERPPSHCLLYDGPRFPVDIAIITAVRVEQEAVLDTLHPEGRDAWAPLETISDGRWQTCTIRSPLSAQIGLRLALGRTRLMGLSATA